LKIIFVSLATAAAASNEIKVGDRAKRDTKVCFYASFYEKLFIGKYKSCWVNIPLEYLLNRIVAKANFLIVPGGG